LIKSALLQQCYIGTWKIFQKIKHDLIESKCIEKAKYQARIIAIFSSKMLCEATLCLLQFSQYTGNLGLTHNSYDSQQSTIPVCA